MSQLKEILEKEKERGSLEQCAVIHLFREGTFYRAYEWSAWLCLRYFTELKVTHRMLKGGIDIIFDPFGRICNPPETNISICNAKKTAKNYVINIIDTRIVLYHFNRN